MYMDDDRSTELTAKEIHSAERVGLIWVLVVLAAAVIIAVSILTLGN